MTDPNQKARDAIERVVAICEVLANLTPDDVDTLADDLRTQWAVEMGLIRIGEAVDRVPKDVLGRFAGQPWRQIMAMRDLAAHQCDDLDPRRVWLTVTREIPLLRAYLVDEVLPGLYR